MPWSGGTVCGFDNGHTVLFTGTDFTRSSTGSSRALRVLLPRSPVDGLGEDAFALLFDPENPYQDHGAFVVFGAAPPTVPVTVYAEKANPRRPSLLPAMAVAEAIAAKLP